MPHPILAQWAGKLLALDELRAFTSEVAAGADSREFCVRLQQRLGLTIDMADAELQHIPASGPTVVVANHSFGLADAVITSNVLFRRRSDIRYLANQHVLEVEGVRDLVFPVDLASTPAARRTNARSLRQSLQWLDAGGLLVVFPAGVVAHWRWTSLGVKEAEWNENPVRLAGRSGAKVVPMWITGSNSATFQIAGLAHPAFRTALLPREFMRRRHFTVQVRIGHAASAQWVERRGPAATAYLRNRCESMRPQRRFPALRLPQWRGLAAPVPAGVLAAEIATLPDDRRLSKGTALEVWRLQMHEAPSVLREIGRLRELTFRAAGEGTGKPGDLDSFDTTYQQLVLWDPAARAVAGGYRFNTEPGGYLNTLFKLDAEFFRRLGPAIELGRSFIAAAYQRQYESLLLLWKAIGAYVVANPRYATLYGPVSISNSYSPLARASLVCGLRKFAWREDLAECAKPRLPFVSLHRPVVAYDLDELDALVADIDGPGKGIPILVRQYLKMGGKLAAFHVDRAFSDTVDGLIAVDLRETPRKLLDRYMGAEGGWQVLKIGGMLSRRGFVAAALARPAPRFFFTARGNSGVRGVGSRLGEQRTDGTGLRFPDFGLPDHIGWLPYCFFRDGRRAILMSLELMPGWQSKTFDEYYPQSRTHLWLYDMDTGKRKELAARERLSSFLAPCVLLPGEERLAATAIVGGKQRLYTMDLDGGGARPVSAAGENVYGVSLSPNGRQFAYHADYRIVTIDIDGANRREVNGAKGQLMFGTSWSPGGDWVLYQVCIPKSDPGHDTSDIWIGRPDGAENRALTSGGEAWFGATYGPKQNPGSGSNMPQWTRDGILFAERSAGAKTPWEFQAGRRDTDHFNRDYLPELARGGTRIARIDPKTGERRGLTEFVEGRWDFRAAALADGEQVLFCRAAVGENPAVWVMNSRGGEARFLNRGFDGQGADHPRW